LRPGVSAEPVTAHEIMTLRCIVPPLQGWEVGTRGAGAGDRFLALSLSETPHLGTRLVATPS
jgi:hypothetical protein